jgi:hypothetical protein
MRNRTLERQSPRRLAVCFLVGAFVMPALADKDAPDHNGKTDKVRFNAAPFLTTTGPLSFFSLAAGDLNGDGKADLVYIPQGEQLVVRLSQGSHTFAPEVVYQTGLSRPSSVLIADVNGDGKPDLVVGGSDIQTDFLTAQGYISVLLGLGDGTFQAPIISASSTALYGVRATAAGDFNEDGNIDLIVSAGNFLELLAGDGTGHFQIVWSVNNFDVASKIIVADLARNGHLDFVISDFYSARVTVYLGQGNGTFSSPVIYDGPAVPLSGDFLVDGIYCGAVADVNGDGIPDLVLSDFNDHIDFLLGQGDGSFKYAPPTTGAYFGDVGVNSGAIAAVEDFNHDGIPDVAVSTVNGIVVFLGNGDLTFKSPTTYPTSGLSPFAAIGDFNGDGNLDIAANSEAFDTRITLLFGEDDGTFQSAVAYDAGARIGDAKIAYANEDRNPDILVSTTRPTVTVLHANGDGRFTFDTDVSPTSAGTLASLAVGDFTGNGHADALLSALSGESLSLQLGNGDGTFQNPIPVPYSALSFGLSPFIADFNGDGKSDIGLIDAASLTILLSNGDGTFQPPIRTFSNSIFVPGFGVPVVGDFNRDGIPDVALSNGAIFLGNGDGTFQPATLYAMPNPPSDVATADLDGDGNLDLVFPISSSNFAVVLFGNGDGTFGAPVEVPTPHLETFVAIGDMNGDGISDLVFSDGLVVTVMLGNGDRTFGAGEDFVAGAGPAKPLISDLNEDGYPDLAIPIFNNNGTTTVVVLLNCGAGLHGPCNSKQHVHGDDNDEER